MGLLRLIILLRSRLNLDDWRVWLRDFQIPPLEFYGLLEAAIRSRQIPDLEISHRDHRERNVLSDRRLYLRLRRDRLLFDCCAAPFGTEYLFSYWLWLMPRRFGAFNFLGLATTITGLSLLAPRTPNLLDAIVAVITVCYLIFLLSKTGLIRRPHWVEEYLHGVSVFGVIYELFFRKPTCFELDTAQIFLYSIHDCYLEVLAGLTETHSLRALTEEEKKKPVMRDFFSK